MKAHPKKRSNLYQVGATISQRKEEDAGSVQAWEHRGIVPHHRGYSCCCSGHQRRLASCQHLLVQSNSHYVRKACLPTAGVVLTDTMAVCYQ